MRARLIVLLAGLALALSATAAAHTSAIKWRWLVIEKDTYATTLPGTLEVTAATDPVLEWPTENTGSMVFPPGTADFENRVQLDVTGPRLGTRVTIDADRTCSNDLDLNATTTTTNHKSYALVVRSGHPTLLPAAVQALHEGVSCLWILDLTIPGTRHATVTMQAKGFQTPGYQPEVLPDPVGGDNYDREACTITVRAGADQRTCKPITTP